MTSQLRRKRQTTARSTSPAIVLSLAVAFLLPTTALPRRAVADSSQQPHSAAKYSTGQKGGRLKWLPERAAGDSAVRTVSHIQTAEPGRTPRTAQNRLPGSGAFSDPFGDKRSAPTEDAETELSTEMLKEPELQESLPKMSPEESTPSALPNLPPNGLSPLTPSKGKEPQRSPLSEELEKEMIARQHEFAEGCPSPKDLKPIHELSTNITPGEGELPRDCPLEGGVFQPRAFAPITYTWAASGLCHKPLYFDDIQLERYGHMWGPWLQPFISGGRFFVNVVLLPYEMGLEPPHECMYTLGYYRPGNCAPYVLDPFPLSVRAALLEGCAWVGGVYAFP